MKLCFTTFACPSSSLRQVIQLASRFQYQGIELRIDAGHAHGVEAWSSTIERKKFRESIEKVDLKVSCIASSLQFTTEGIIDQAAERIKLVADMGAKGIRVFHGPLPDGMRVLAECRDRVVRQLTEAAEVAQLLETEIWIETHDMVSTGADVAALVRAVDRPNVGVCYNNMHPIRMGESLETTIAHLAPMIRHVHLHDGLAHPEKVIVTPVGQGEMPMDDTMQALIKIGYDQFLSGEWFHNQYGDRPEDAMELYAHDMKILTHRYGVALGLGV